MDDLLRRYDSSSDGYDNDKMPSPFIQKGLVAFLHSQSSNLDTAAERLVEIAIQRGVLNIDDKQLVNFKNLKVAISRVIAKLKSKKNYQRDEPSIIKLMNEEFKISLTTPEVASTSTTTTTTTTTEMLEPELSCSSMGKLPVSLKTLPKPSPKKLNSDCQKCIHRRESIEKLVAAKRNLKQSVEALYVSSFEARDLRQAVKRKREVEDNLRDERRKLKRALKESNNTIQKLKKGATYVCKKKTVVVKRKHNCKFRRQLSIAHKEGNALKKKLKQVELENDHLRGLLFEEEENMNVISAKKDLKTFSSGYRKAAYGCLLNQVPVETVGIVINSIIKEMTHMKVDTKADATTVAQFAYEIGVLNDIQICEAIVQADNVTLGWDATSLDSEHVNEVHLMFPGDPPKGMELQISPLAGGTTQDYTQHIKNSIHDVCEVYAEYYKTSSMDVSRTVVSKLKNTISDRVGVNHCVRKQLEEDLDIQLLELNCNVHPLDGIANEARKTLEGIETKYGVRRDLFGKGCAADTLIYSLSKMRYKSGKGDPKGFKMFLQKEGIKSHSIVRYVGNRLHLLFHLAGVYYSLQHLLINYLESFCNNTSSLRAALKKDFSNPSIVEHLRALGFIGKLVTGPWMHMMYGNKAGKSNLEVVPEFKLAVNNLQTWEQDPLNALETKVDVFGQPLDDDDEVLSSLQKTSIDPCMLDEVKDVISSLVRGTIKVLTRQLERYLIGDLSEPNQEMIDQTKSAPIHNIFSERVLGMVDHQHKRAPNASYGFIDAKVKAGKNQTLDWLDSKDRNEQERLISFAIQKAREIRRIRKERQQLHEKEYLLRQNRKKQKKEQTYRKNIEKKVKNLLSSGDEYDLHDFQISQENKDTLCQILTNNKVLEGRNIDHLWFLDNSGDVVYHGRIHCVKTNRKTNNITLKVSYWLDSETEADGEDHSLPLSQFLTDFLLGDLILI